MTRQKPYCRDHETYMVLYAGGDFGCLQCEAGEPPISRFRGRPMTREYETKEEFQQALAEFEKEQERRRRGADRIRGIRRGEVREQFHR